jgi:hypothetical protein
MPEFNSVSSRLEELIGLLATSVHGDPLAAALMEEHLNELNLASVPAAPASNTRAGAPCP